VKCASHVIAAIWLVAACAGCATTEGRFSPLGTASYQPRAANAPIEVFRSGLPERAFDRIARLDAHIERTAWVPSGINDALPELMKQARAAGGDAIIEFEEKRSQVLETKVYHVTATAVRYRDSASRTR
jgi:hypothetical protein